MHIDPNVEAAFIGGAVALTGIVAAVWGGNRSTRTTVELAREQRIWDRQADVYAEIMAYSAHRSATRNRFIRPKPLDREEQERIDHELAGYTPPPWYVFEGRVRAYASDGTVRAFDDAHRLDAKAWALFAVQKSVNTTSSREVESNVLSVILEARAAAEIAEATLQTAVRNELQLPRPRRASLRTRVGVWRRRWRLWRAILSVRAAGRAAKRRNLTR